MGDLYYDPMEEHVLIKWLRKHHWLHDWGPWTTVNGYAVAQWRECKNSDCKRRIAHNYH